MLVALLACLLAGVGSAACSSGLAAAGDSSAGPTSGPLGTTYTGGYRADLVRRSGAGFTLGGEPFRFVGFNLYDAASSVRYTCVSWPRYTDAELDAAFRYMHDEAGATVVRFWAYQTYTQGGTYFTGVDRVLAAARRYDLKVIPALEDGPGNCTTGPRQQPKTGYKGDTWYSAGFRVPFGTAKISYLDYVRILTAHYRGNPTILGWSMMNEAETGQRDSAGRSELVDFARVVAAVIKKADPTHLLTVGTQSNGAPGASGADFAAVYALPQVDFAEVHDYASHGSDTVALFGGSAGGTGLPDPRSAECQVSTAPIACSMAIAIEVLHKPLVIGEAGIEARTAQQRQQRSVRFYAKMSAAFRVGASGYLVWQFNKVLDTAYDVQATDQDPLVTVLREVAAGLGS